MFPSIATDLVQTTSHYGCTGVNNFFVGDVIASGYSDDYEQRDDFRPQKRYSPREQSFSTLGGLLKNQKQMGAGLLGIGALLTVMGMMLFFEGTLLRLGNVSSTHLILLSAHCVPG
jgi:hypothetical protein